MSSHLIIKHRHYVAVSLQTTGYMLPSGYRLPSVYRLQTPVYYIETSHHALLRASKYTTNQILTNCTEKLMKLFNNATQHTRKNKYIIHNVIISNSILT